MSQHFRRLFPLLLLIFLDSFSYFVILPVLLQLFFHDQYGLLATGASQNTRNFLTGFTICLSPLAALLAAPIIGSASDKYGRKKTLLICLVGTALGFLLLIISLFVTYMGILMCVGLLILYPLFIRIFHIKTLLRLSMILVLAGLLGCSIFSAPLGQWIFVPLVAIFVGIAYVSLITLISNQVGVKHQGWAMGYMSSTLFIAWLLTAFNGGWLMSINGILPLYIATCIITIGVILLLRYY